MVLVFYAKAGNALPAVDVKDPKRNSVFSGNTREEVGEGLGKVIVPDDESAVFLKKIFRILTFRLVSHNKSIFYT